MLKVEQVFPLLYLDHDMGLATIIGKTDRDASGHKIDIAMHSRMDRLRIWDYRTQSSTHRNLRQAFNWLDVFKDKLVLSDAVVEKSAYIYRKAQGKRIGTWEDYIYRTPLRHMLRVGKWGFQKH